MTKTRVGQHADIHVSTTQRCEQTYAMQRQQLPSKHQNDAGSSCLIMKSWCLHMQRAAANAQVSVAFQHPLENAAGVWLAFLYMV